MVKQLDIIMTRETESVEHQPLNNTSSQPPRIIPADVTKSNLANLRVREAMRRYFVTERPHSSSTLQPDTMALNLTLPPIVHEKDGVTPIMVAYGTISAITLVMAAAIFAKIPRRNDVVNE
jgi:hypothetical protein